MLTVKWQYTVNGVQVEHLYEAENVTGAFPEIQPPGAASRQNPTPHVCGRYIDRPTVILDGYDLTGRSFGNGKVYVMNEGGKTIASYDLGDGMVVYDDRGIPSPVGSGERTAA